MSRVLTSAISGSDCLSISLCAINTNFSNLDTTICSASSTYRALNLTTSKGITGTSVYGIPGLITAYAGIHIPNYWTACDGTELDRASYASLYNVIGNNFGSPSTNLKFVLPNLQTDTNDIATAPRGATSISSGAYTTSTVAPTARVLVTGPTGGTYGQIRPGPVTYFNNISNWPSGFYRVVYIDGAYSETSNNRTLGTECNINYINSSNNAQIDPIGIYSGDVGYSTAISNTQNYNGTGAPYYYDFYHYGGELSVNISDSVFSDNQVSPSGAPIWALYSVIPTLAVNYIISTNN